MVYVIAGVVAVAVIAGVGYYLYSQGKLPLGKKAESSSEMSSAVSQTSGEETSSESSQPES